MSESQITVRVGIPSGGTLLPGTAILRYSSASRLWKATESSPFSSMRYSMNRAQILGSMVSRKSATLGRGSSTSSDWKIYRKGKIEISGAVSGIGPTRRTHLKSDVLVLLKNPSGGFEDLLYVFLSQLLEIRHSWLELFAHVTFVLAETECRLMGHTGFRSPSGGRCQETHCRNRSKAWECIFFPLYRNISSENFYKAKKKRQDHDPTRASKENRQTSRSFNRVSTSDTSHQFSIRHNDPSRPGIVNRYDLNSAVYTTCANRMSWSGVKAVSGMLGIPLKSSTVASDSGETL